MEIERRTEGGIGAPDASTRQRVARALLEHRAATAAELADGLQLTPAGVRRHLDQLVDQGLAEVAEVPVRPGSTRGRGRPARAFGLTERGRDAFEQAYDDLAVSALRFLAQTGGDEAVHEFARRRVGELESRYAPALAGLPEEERPQALARALTGDGYAASVRSAPHGAQVCQHHCPVAHVAEEFPQLCEAETEVFARLLGRHVQRLATIARGDGVCTTNVPEPTQPPQQRLRSETGRNQPSTSSSSTAQTTRFPGATQTRSSERTSV
ncbi:MAG TPA: metalloregulator ArsR/SmtB family transcription factor [Nocardioidaceae bacterium]|nr:metalloregulator ArsR/SmtB family transcription factor [Nocardioidaceae bacterium]